MSAETGACPDLQELLQDVAKGGTGGKAWHEQMAQDGPGKMHILDVFSQTLAKVDYKRVNELVADVTKESRECGASILGGVCLCCVTKTQRRLVLV